MIDPGHTPSLSDQAILSLWQDGRRHAPAERAHAILLHALPVGERAALDDWSIGRRDARLLGVHAATFGQRITAVTACARCGESIDLTFDTQDIRSPFGAAGRQLEVTSTDQSYRIVCRLPSSADLRTVAWMGTVEDARRALAERCVVAVERDGVPVAPSTLPDEAIECMSEAMALADPQSDVELALICPACGERWVAHFDIVDYLWRLVIARARRLVYDVHILATAYGWREADILAMPRDRRQLYLDLVMG